MISLPSHHSSSLRLINWTLPTRFSSPMSLFVSPICAPNCLRTSISSVGCSFGQATSSRSFKSFSSILACKRREFELDSVSVGEVPPMTIKAAVRIAEGKLVVNNRTILTNVPDNVIATSSSESGPEEGVFLGAFFDKESNSHVASLGNLRDVRFMASFRFKLWWMAQKMGDKGRDIPLETQFLLVETKDGSHLSDNRNGENQVVYVVFLPLIEGPFRACLQGNPKDELELCLESGDSETTASTFTHSIYIASGTDPFGTITDAIKVVKQYLKTFRQRHEKKLPEIVDFFGWCTWDAFYQEVSQEGVEAGLRTLAAQGTPPKFVIIDDGWQLVGLDTPKKQMEEGKEHQHEPQQQQPTLMRLTGIKENEKFQKKGDPTVGIKNIVNLAKNEHGLKYVYVWHAITGYWGGVRPDVKEMEQYGSVIKYPVVSKGVLENEPGWKTDPMAVQGMGFMDPNNVYRFYNELHNYLASAGVDGVKVDVQCILETLGAGLGGRVELTRRYHQALDASIARNFPDNGCIACMSHNTDALYCCKQTAVVRASDDFYPCDPVSHTIHIAAVAYNSIFLGEFMLPDWDMFHSLHPAAEYHASARAISGGPIYVSDAPGKHNCDLLRKVVLPDGSILRALLPGRPTQDCLFSDPARDGVSLLKIWNMNKYSGVLGVYNCQGAAWNSVERKNTFHHAGADALTGYVRCRDVHLIANVAQDSNWSGDCAVYCHRSGEVVILPQNAAMPVSLEVLEHDIFTITPIKVLATGSIFAPLGLIDMFNAGGAIEELKYEVKNGCELYEGDDIGITGRSVDDLSTKMAALVSMQIKGCGRFGAYSLAKPWKCMVDSASVDFEFNSESGLVTLNLKYMPSLNQKFHVVELVL